MSCIDDAVRKTSANWRPIQEPEKDYNLVDVFDLAGTLQIACSLVLGQPSNNLSKEEIVQPLVELVETELHPNTDPIRSRNSVQLIEELRSTGARVLEIHSDFGSPEEAIMKSLFIWFGCLQIDKSCRREDASGKPFDLGNSLSIHDELVILSKTNPWIKLGFISAKYFRQYEKQNKYYCWIPKDSPYWELV
jgi:hypothetical protein